jgi:hypothetical protein
VLRSLAKETFILETTRFSAGLSYAFTGPL